MFTAENTELTPREHILMENENEQMRLAREHAITIKRLEIEQQKLEAKWSAWLRLPSIILKLPLLILLGFSYIIAVARKHDVSKEFWNIIK